MRLVEHYFWTSVSLVTLLAVATYNKLEKESRRRNHYYNNSSPYDDYADYYGDRDGYGRRIKYEGSTETARLKRRNQGLVHKTLN